MKKKSIHIDMLDAILPQTQCGLCEYPGCKPYATAMVEKNERIDKCLPGGIDVLRKLAALTQQSATPYEADMAKKMKPDVRAVIREKACIGCTKCIQACPVDAIIGGAKVMTTIIADVCNGCELCVPTCPMDCIDLIPLAKRTDEERQQLADQSRRRFHQHEMRLARSQTEDQQRHQQTKQSFTAGNLTDRKLAIAAAVARAKQKRHTS